MVVRLKCLLSVNSMPLAYFHRFDPINKLMIVPSWRLREE